MPHSLSRIHWRGCPEADVEEFDDLADGAILAVPCHDHQAVLLTEYPQNKSEFGTASPAEAGVSWPNPVYPCLHGVDFQARL